MLVKGSAVVSRGRAWKQGSTSPVYQLETGGGRLPLAAYLSWQAPPLWLFAQGYRRSILRLATPKTMRLVSRNTFYSHTR